MTAPVSPSRDAARGPSAEPLRKSRQRQWPIGIGICLVALALVAVLAPLLSPFGQNQGSLSARLLPPGTLSDMGWHLFGTDGLGRDVAARIAYGLRVSLVVGVVGVSLAATVGSLLGIVAGMGSKWFDSLVMRAVDVALSVPPILIAILIAVLLRPSLLTVFLVIGLMLWPQYARMARAEVLTIRRSDYVQAALVAGIPQWRILCRHTVPNVLPPLLVLATLHVGTAIVLESSVSFLGIGLPPSSASLGGMVNEGRAALEEAWWISVFPGLVIVMCVYGLNSLGDWARVRFDPRLEQAR